MPEEDTRNVEVEFTCALSARALKARRTELRKTIRPHILSVHHTPLKVTLTLSSAVSPAQLEAFVAFEQSCCGFLSFSISPTTGGTRLEIAGPPGTEKVLEMFARGAA